jgi:hypothetical protein
MLLLYIFLNQKKLNGIKSAEHENKIHFKNSNNMQLRTVNNLIASYVTIIAAD